MKGISAPTASYRWQRETWASGLGAVRGADGVFRLSDGTTLAQLFSGQENPSYHLSVYGCQMNEHDAEILAGELEELGYRPAARADEADVVLLVSCTVRETAAQKILGELGRLKSLKERRPHMILGVSGCLPQEGERGREMGSLHPHVDLVFGTHNLHLLPEMLERVARTREQVVEVWEGAREVVEDLPARREDGWRAWVTVIHGCDKFCTYCIVPHTRGRERSRRPEAIRREVEELAERGFKEITLLGQNVSSYGKDLDGYRFGDLLRDLDRIPGIEWIRFLTSHPRDFSPELVDLIAGLEKVCEHFHLPVQAGSNRVLRRMNRGYTREEYLALVEHIRKRIPGAAVTTDLIVGFPGEEEEDFRATLDLVRQADFDHAFLFIYSPRRGTPAARWEDRVRPEEKKARFDRLAELQYSISLRRNRALLGQRHKVLFEGPSKKNSAVWTARNRQNRLFLIPGPEAGKERAEPFAEVRVEEAGTFTLRASLLGFSGDGRDPALRLPS